jgi:hypothetical protein
MENYLSYIGTYEEMRTQLDTGYQIEKQSILIFEIRPDWIDPNKKVKKK